ncbi:MAG: cyclic dehypoxanthinyl futalosine synthase [bacterium]
MNLKLSKNEIIELLSENDILKLAGIADEVKQELHYNTDIATFVVDRNINYTNICSCKCKFCAFYKTKDQDDSYILFYPEIKEKIQELVDIKGTQILMQGGLNSALGFDYYLNIVSSIKKDFPSIDIHSFSPAEIDFIAKNEKISHIEVIQEFKKLGLSSIPGGGAEILSDNIRNKISPNKITSERWLEIMKSVHELGMSSTATMVYGFGESLEDIFEHLEKIKKLQSETGGFTAFIPWSFAAENTELASNVKFYETTAFDYLKILAVSRIMLNNIKNIQVSWVTQGLKVAQLGLKFGANDFGGTMLEENVVKAAGVVNKSTKTEIIKNIKMAGFVPAQRNTAYELLNIYN